MEFSSAILAFMEKSDLMLFESGCRLTERVPFERYSMIELRGMFSMSSGSSSNDSMKSSCSCFEVNVVPIVSLNLDVYSTASSKE